MASDEEVFNIGVVRNVETFNFSFGVIIIRRSIRPAETLQESDGPVSYMNESDSKLEMTPWSIKDGLESENVQHESFSYRRNGQDCFWARFHPRSFTTTKRIRKVQPV